MPCPIVESSSDQSAASTYSAGQQIKVEWNGSWWDAIIREVSGESYHIHYVGFDPSWDEWVDLNRIRTS